MQKRAANLRENGGWASPKWTDAEIRFATRSKCATILKLAAT